MDYVKEIRKKLEKKERERKIKEEKRKKILNPIILSVFYTLFGGFWFYLYQVMNSQDFLYTSITFGFLWLGLLISTATSLYKMKSDELGYFFVIMMTVSGIILSKLDNFITDYSLTGKLFLSTVLLISYIVSFLFMFFDKVLLKISESFVFALSLAFAYWLLVNSWDINNILLYLAWFFTSLVFIEALLKDGGLREGMRFYLSFFGSIVIFVLSYSHLKEIYLGLVNPVAHFEIWKISLDYFLVGLSLVYIILNLFLIFGFLFAIHAELDGGRGALSDFINIHSERVSTKQMYYEELIYIFIFSIIPYSINYYYHFISPNLLIWIVLGILSYKGLVMTWKGDK